MPVVDRRTFGNRFSVKENARRLANYRYAELQIMEMIGGWCVTLPEMSVKITLGYHMWDQAKIADAFGKRMVELQLTLRQTHAPNDDFVRLCEEIWNTPDTLRRLVGIYRVLKQHLLNNYLYHLEATDAIADNPTVQILKPMIETTQKHIGWGNSVIENLSDMPQKRRETVEWQAHLEELLVQCRGVTGRGADEHWLPYTDTDETEVSDEENVEPWSKVTYTFSKKLPYIKEPARDSRWKIVPVNELPPSPPFTEVAGRVYTLHTLLNNEIVTVERMGKMLAEFPELPWEMRMDLAHQAWDESRHAEIVAARIEGLGGFIGQHPVYFYTWEFNENHPDPLARMAYGNRLAERIACGRLKIWKDEAQKAGDTQTAQLFDYVLADEIMHAYYGRHWIDILTKNDPERRKRVLAHADELAARRANASKWFSPSDGSESAEMFEEQQSEYGS
jgi:uncharacterized ferritin-like protein (DUF455 family)